ncbi:MAG: DNA polymerase III subunit alpha [Bryobacteraceae bacterium]
MPARDYVELHAKSAFSFLEGASTPEQLAAECARYGQHAIALTDANGVYGSPRLHYTARKIGIKPLVGAEVGLQSGARLTLLVESQAGYKNLTQLITRTKLRNGLNGKIENPIAFLEDLALHAEGLICITGGDEGPIALALKKVESSTAVRHQIEELIGIYGRRNVYIELQRHGRRDQEYRNQALIPIAKNLRLPLLATNGVLYADIQSRPLQDVLTCLRQKKTLEKVGRLLCQNAQAYLRSSEEMLQVFADLPEATANTVVLADRLGFTLQNLGYEFPTFPTPEGEPEICFLRKCTVEGAIGRYGIDHPKAYAQIDHELKLIEKLKLAGYFLIVWDIVRFARSRGFLVQGRGSAANSAVCYSLGITSVDAVGMGLLFERFLSEERGEWPDIDLDLPSDTNREEVIQYVFQRYGAHGAAMTANVITYRSRSAVRDVGKVLGFGEEELGRLAAEMPHFEWKDEKDTMEKRFRDSGLDIGDPRIAHFFRLTQEIMHLPRHLGQHSGGMIVCQGKLDQVVPLEPASMPNRTVVQWDKDDCADLGIVKIDLLGLGMLAVLQDCIEVVRRDYGDLVDLAHLPQEDPAVYDALQKADTIGLFQVESRAQQAILPRMKPVNFYDIVVQVAIIRPGPIVGQMLHPYLRRRQKLEEPESLHPWLDEVLARTLGVPLFQEQLLRMAMIVANFTGGEAEELRRAMGFKRSEKRMQEVEIKLRRGMTQNRIDQPTQERIIQSITSFALYGFPESHAASFALIAYASAYLKTHYLAGFTVCILNNQPMGFYSPATLVTDAKRHGQRFRPVDVTRSQCECTIETEADIRYVRLGFNYVKGLRGQTAQAIVAARESTQFASMRDLRRRVPSMNKKEFSALAELGALNALPDYPQDRHRRGALWHATAAAMPVSDLLESAVHDSEPSPLEPMTPQQRIYADFQNSGLTIGRHPMSFYRSGLRDTGVLDSGEAKRQPDGAVIRVAGCVITRQRPGTAKGFVFLSLEDETGIVNIIINPDLFDRNRTACVAAPYVQVKGIVQNTWNVISIKAADVQALALGDETIQSHDFH